MGTMSAETRSRLIGAKVIGCDYEDGCDQFAIVTDKGKVTLTAYGDCCSESWFQAFDRLEDLVGQVISGVEEREEERDRSKDEPCRDSETQLYGIVFEHVGGSSYLELRNDSNGYYGGSITESWEDGHA